MDYGDSAPQGTRQLYQQSAVEKRIWKPQESRKNEKGNNYTDQTADHKVRDGDERKDAKEMDCLACINNGDAEASARRPATPAYS